jgi:hypothetical protein
VTAKGAIVAGIQKVAGRGLSAHLSLRPVAAAVRRGRLQSDLFQSEECDFSGRWTTGRWAGRWARRVRGWCASVRCRGSGESKLGAPGGGIGPKYRAAELVDAIRTFAPCLGHSAARETGAHVPEVGEELVDLRVDAE